MLISKKALLYFAVAMKVNWLVMVLFYQPTLMIMCFLISLIGLIFFVKPYLKKLISIALFGWSLDCIWHSTGIITFDNAQYLPFWLLSIWLVYSVFIVYFFERFKHYALFIPIIFAFSNLTSFIIGINIGDSVVHNNIYYVATLIGWSAMGYIILNLNTLKYSNKKTLSQ